MLQRQAFERPETSELVPHMPVVEAVACNWLGSSTTTWVSASATKVGAKDKLIAVMATDKHPVRTRHDLMAPIVAPAWT